MPFELLGTLEGLASVSQRRAQVAAELRPRAEHGEAAAAQLAEAQARSADLERRCAQAEAARPSHGTLEV